MTRPLETCLSLSSAPPHTWLVVLRVNFSFVSSGSLPDHQRMQSFLFCTDLSIMWCYSRLETVMCIVKQAAVGQGFTCRGLATTGQYSLMRARSIGVICQDFEGDSSPSWTHRNMGLWVLVRLARSLQICKRKEKKQPRILQWQYIYIYIYIYIYFKVTILLLLVVWGNPSPWSLSHNEIITIYV